MGKSIAKSGDIDHLNPVESDHLLSGANWPPPFSPHFLLILSVLDGYTNIHFFIAVISLRLVQ